MRRKLLGVSYPYAVAGSRWVGARPVGRVPKKNARVRVGQTAVERRCGEKTAESDEGAVGAVGAVGEPGRGGFGRAGATGC